jgi:ABC-type proline/glycine betaine transport system permease subunit
MKELLRFVAYGAATITMMLVLIGIAQAGITKGGLVFAAIMVVVVLPVAIGIWMARREKRAE